MGMTLQEEAALRAENNALREGVKMLREELSAALEPIAQTAARAEGAAWVCESESAPGRAGEAHVCGAARAEALSGVWVSATRGQHCPVALQGHERWQMPKLDWGRQAVAYVPTWGKGG